MRLAGGERPAVAHSARVRRLLARTAERFRAEAVNLVASHLFVAGGKESDSERPIQLGGACAVDAEAFPSIAQYVALGKRSARESSPPSPSAGRRWGPGWETHY